MGTQLCGTMVEENPWISTAVLHKALENFIFYTLFSLHFAMWLKCFPRSPEGRTEESKYEV